MGVNLQRIKTSIEAFPVHVYPPSLKLFSPNDKRIFFHPGMSAFERFSVGNPRDEGSSQVIGDPDRAYGLPALLPPGQTLRLVTFDPFTAGWLSRNSVLS